MHSYVSWQGWRSGKRQGACEEVEDRILIAGTLGCSGGPSTLLKDHILTSDLVATFITIFQEELARVHGSPGVRRRG
jgi:hypothetical protein